MVTDDNNFDELQDALDDGLADGLERLHGRVLRATIQNMAQGQDALGNPWQPLAAETIAAKGSSTPLIDESRLISDINAASEVDRTALEGIIGTNLEYAKPHELGAPEQGIPRRPIFAPAGDLAAELSEDELSVAIGEAIAEVEL